MDQWGKEDKLGRFSSSLYFVMNIFKCMQLFITKSWSLLEGTWETVSGFIKGTLRYFTGVAGESGFGSKSTAEQVSQIIPSSMASKLTAIVTGATSGIGAETARVLAKSGVRLVIPARDMNRATKTKEMILKESPHAEIIVQELNLSSFASINRFCSTFLSLKLPLHLLINNAGKYCHRLELSEDKFEMSFATNYLGHFLLTENLLEKMVETADQSGIEGRIVNVSSIAHSWVSRERFQFHDILNPKSYNGPRAYCQSKLANILHAKELATQLQARNAHVTVNAVHPGIVKTGIARDHNGFISADSLYYLGAKLLKTIPQGAATTCYVALTPQLKGVTGKYFSDCNETPCSSLANDKNEARKLWKQTYSIIHTHL